MYIQIKYCILKTGATTFTKVTSMEREEEKTISVRDSMGNLA